MVERHYLLDFVRGCTAFGVVIWHYQHFFNPWPGQPVAVFNKAAQPLYGQLWPIYDGGPLRMSLFFTLSGFVVFFSYFDRIRSRSMSAGRFALLRLTRLYPLHIATLLLVAALQYMNHARYGSFFVYPCNDLSHFLQNVFLVVWWSPLDEPCYSFNGPVWSLSAEMFLYIAFFVLARNLPARRAGQIAAITAALVVGATFMSFEGYHLLGEPLLCFFAGGLTLMGWRELDRSTSTRRVIALAISSVTCLAACLLYRSSSQRLFLDIVLLPSAVMSIALLQCLLPDIGKNVKYFGEISYSTFLIHFPIQALLVMIVTYFALPIRFAEPSIFIAYLTLIFLCSALVHRLFERPTRSFLRRLLASASATRASRQEPRALPPFRWDETPAGTPT